MVKVGAVGAEALSLGKDAVAEARREDDRSQAEGARAGLRASVEERSQVAVEAEVAEEAGAMLRQQFYTL